MFNFDLFSAIGVIPVAALDAHQHVSPYAAAFGDGATTLDISVGDATNGNQGGK